MTRTLPNEPVAAGGRGRFLAEAAHRIKRTLLRASRPNWTWAAWGTAAFCASMASIIAAPGWRGALGAGLAAAMTAIAAIDARHFIIPDKLVLAGLALGLADASIADPEHAVTGLASAAARGFALALVFFAFRAAYRRIRGREGLGLGDVKLAAVAGTWLGWTAAGLAVDIAALAALAAVIIDARRGQHITSATRIPFGLFLAPAIWIAWLAGIIGVPTPP